jgi:hypothetical protein
MTRKPYTLSEEEIEVLIDGIMKHGDEATYMQMKYKTLISMDKKDDLDEMLMDMHETILARARKSSTENKIDKELRKILYQLASMLRILAHEIYREYIKNGKSRDSERFLRLVSLNKDAPVTL